MIIVGVGLLIVYYAPVFFSPSCLPYIETGDRMHAVTYALRYMYQWFFAQTMKDFNFGIGIDLAKTYLYKGNF